MQENQYVLFEEIKGKDGNVGMITLNRPKALNALNLEMFIAMDKHLKEWQTNDNIKAVIIKAVEGRAFSAGGDIRAVYDAKKNKESHMENFFRDEYSFDARTFHFTKPYIALLDGITMGGGVGISIHASHRVATENFLFAMPETGIGFYPDVSSTYFLPRLPGKIGFYLGLTGMRLAYNDCYEIGIVNHVTHKDKFPEIINAIVEAPLNDHPKKVITEIINKYNITFPKGKILQKRAAIDVCFAKATLEEILDALHRYPDAWTSTLVSEFINKSPTSLKVTLKQLQTGLNLNFDECMQLEMQLTTRFTEGHDFFEGIRAVLIDKDNNPRWKPAKIDEVSDEMVGEYFKNCAYG